MYFLQPLAMSETGFYQEGLDTDFENWVTPYIRNMPGGAPDELIPADHDIWM